VSPLRAVLLDAGGTLFTERSSRAAIYAATARRHGLAVDETATARAMKAVHARLPRRLDDAGGAFRYSPRWFERFIAEVFAETGAAALPAGLVPDLFTTFADPATFRVFDDVVPALARLREEGVKTAVVSNWSPALPRLLAGLGLAPDLDAVVVSAVERTEKPEPGIFTLALRRLGVPASEALHVGDDPVKDVGGAQSAGIAARLLDRSARDPTAWRSLAPLAELVKKGGSGDPGEAPKGPE
jgi:putative hydrolase of the HAD superfamily